MIAIGILLYVGDKIDYEQENEKDAEGNVTSSTTTWSWNAAAPVDMETFEGDQFLANQFIIESTWHYAPALPSNESPDISQVIVRVNNKVSHQHSPL